MTTLSPAPINPFTDVMDMIDSNSIRQSYLLPGINNGALIANTEAIINLTAKIALLTSHTETDKWEKSNAPTIKAHFEQESGNNDLVASSTAGKEDGHSDVLKTVTGVLKGGVEIAESFGFSEKVAKLRELSEGLSAFGEMAEAIDAAKNTHGAEAITKLGNAITSFANLAKATSIPSAVVGLGFKSVWDFSQERTRSFHPKVDRTTFMSPDVVASTPHVQWIAENVAYAKQVAERTRQKPAAQLQQDQQRYEENFSKKGGELHFSDKLAREDPAYISAIVNAMMKSEERSDHPIKNILFDTPELLSEFQKNVDPLHRFSTRLADKKVVSPFHTNGIQNVSEVKDYVKQEEFTSYDLLNFAFQVDYRLKDEVEKGLAGYTQNPLGYTKGHENTIFNMFGRIPAAREKSNDAVDWFFRGTKEIDAEKNTKQSKNIAYPGTGNTINIKSLIEHFTINVKDSREGIRDFKRKVEEALLEILNSINAQ